MTRKIDAAWAALLLGCSSAHDPTPPAPAPDAGAAPPPAACIATGKSCTGNVNGCCNGGICTADVKTPTVATCLSTCLSNDQCESKCCTALNNGTGKVCAPTSAACANSCVKAGELCASATCCSDSVCVVSTVDGTRCAALCAKHADCKSLCCALLKDSTTLVCSPPTFCP